MAKLRSEFVQLPSEKLIYEFQIFGFPTHYTDVGNLNNKDRKRLLVKAWSVPVVSHLVKGIQQYISNSGKQTNEVESNLVPNQTQPMEQEQMHI